MPSEYHPRPLNWHPIRCPTLLQERLELTAGARREELDSTKFEDLLVIKAIGSGSFGHVNLVVHQPTNLPCAAATCHRQRRTSP